LQREWDSTSIMEAGKVWDPWQTWLKWGEKKTQISKIRNAKGDITTNTMEIQEIIRDYFENKVQIWKFWRNGQISTYLWPSKIEPRGYNHLNWSITQNEIEAARVSQKRKVQDLMDSLLNSIRPLKKN
jgi:hypothetical protein